MEYLDDNILEMLVHDQRIKNLYNNLYKISRSNASSEVWSKAMRFFIEEVVDRANQLCYPIQIPKEEDLYTDFAFDTFSRIHNKIIEEKDN